MFAGPYMSVYGALSQFCLPNQAYTGMEREEREWRKNCGWSKGEGERMEV